MEWAFDDSEVHLDEKMVIVLDACAYGLEVTNDAVEFSTRLSIPKERNYLKTWGLRWNL